MIDKKVIIIYNAAHHVLLFKKELIVTIKKNGFQIIVLASKDDYVEKLKLIYTYKWKLLFQQIQPGISTILG